MVAVLFGQGFVVSPVLYLLQYRPVEPSHLDQKFLAMNHTSVNRCALNLSNQMRHLLLKFFLAGLIFAGVLWYGWQKQQDSDKQLPDEAAKLSQSAN